MLQTVDPLVLVQRFVVVAGDLDAYERQIQVRAANVTLELLQRGSLLLRFDLLGLVDAVVLYKGNRNYNANGETSKASTHLDNLSLLLFLVVDVADHRQHLHERVVVAALIVRDGKHELLDGEHGRFTAFANVLRGEERKKLTSQKKTYNTTN